MGPKLEHVRPEETHGLSLGPWAANPWLSDPPDWPAGLSRFCRMAGYICDLMSRPFFSRIEAFSTFLRL